MADRQNGGAILTSAPGLSVVRSAASADGQVVLFSSRGDFGFADTNGFEDDLFAFAHDGADPGTVQFSAPTYPVGEGNDVTITVTRTGGSEGPVSVDFDIGGGTATALNDYSTFGFPRTLHWNNGETGSKTFTVTTLQDALAEGNETINLTSSHPTGGVTMGAEAVLTILDNDNAIQVQFMLPRTSSARETAKRPSPSRAAATRVRWSA